MVCYLNLYDIEGYKIGGLDIFINFQTHWKLSNIGFGTIFFIIQLIKYYLSTHFNPYNVSLL